MEKLIAADYLNLQLYSLPIFDMAGIIVNPLTVYQGLGHWAISVADKHGVKSFGVVFIR